MRRVLGLVALGCFAASCGGGEAGQSLTPVETSTASTPAAPAESHPTATLPGRPSLLDARVRESTKRVEAAIRVGADLEERDASGRTALLVATRENQIDVAARLVEAGADVNAKDAIEDTPYLYAAAEGRLEILELTLTHGANLRDTNRFGGTGLIPAAHHGHVEVVRRLLRTPIAVDHVNNLGWTALLEAVILGDGGAAHTEIVRLLIEAGANPNLPDGNGVTPLAHAEQRGYTAIAGLLRAAGGR